MGRGVLMKFFYLLLELLATSESYRRKWPGSRACFLLAKNAVGTLEAGQDLRMVCNILLTSRNFLLEY